MEYLIILAVIAGLFYMLSDHTPSEDNAKQPDQEKVTHKEIAEALFALAWRASSLSPAEKAVVSRANINEAKYEFEVFMLTCFAIHTALILNFMQHNKSEGEKLRKLWMEEWEAFSRKGKQQSDATIYFMQRLKSYGTAFQKDLSAPEGALSTEMASEFIKLIKDNNDEIPYEFMGAATVYFDSSYKLATDLLVQLSPKAGIEIHTLKSSQPPN